MMADEKKTPEAEAEAPKVEETAATEEAQVEAAAEEAAPAAEEAPAADALLGRHAEG